MVQLDETTERTLAGRGDRTALAADRVDSNATRQYMLAHLSDPHLGPLPRVGLNRLLSKRLIGYINWQSNRARLHRPEIVESLIAALQTVQPDHTVVTGDLVNIALPEEIAAAKRWLQQLGMPHNVTVIPGNHDAYVPGALAETRRQWRDFMIGDEVADAVSFPFVRLRGPLGIVGVNSARATAPFMATGHLSGRQLEMLGLALRRLHRRNCFRVVILHHPPAPEVEYRSQRLVEADAFRQVIADEGAELVLHGHLHAGTLVYIDGKHGRVPVVGVPSASNPPGNSRPGAAFNVYAIGGRPGRFSCHMTTIGFAGTGSTTAPINERQLIG